MKNSVLEKSKETEKPVVPTRQISSYPLHLLQRDMNQLFEDFARGFDMFRPRFAEPFFGEFHMKIDVKQDDKEMVITAEVPGVDVHDIEIELGADTLMIKGEKKEEKEEREKGYFHSERSFGSFQRVLPLPFAIMRDQVEAIYNHGVLKITLPKSTEPLKAMTRIEIKTI